VARLYIGYDHVAEDIVDFPLTPGDEAVAEAWVQQQHCCTRAAAIMTQKGQRNSLNR
jgi:hypothetical protein